MSQAETVKKFVFGRLFLWCNIASVVVVQGHHSGAMPIADLVQALHQMPILLQLGFEPQTSYIGCDSPTV